MTASRVATSLAQHWQHIIDKTQWMLGRIALEFNCGPRCVSCSGSRHNAFGGSINTLLTHVSYLWLLCRRKFGFELAFGVPDINQSVLRAAINCLSIGRDR